MDGVSQGPGDAAGFVAEAVTGRPQLIVYGSDLPATARSLRDLLAASGCLFDRGVPVKVVQSADRGPPEAVRLTVNSVVFEAHRLCCPIKQNEKGMLIPVTLPDRVARMYLDMTGEWGLPPLYGIATAPLLASDGTVRTAEGYDRVTGLWCSTVPTLKLLDQPMRADAEAALRLMRETFQTFPFADSARRWDGELGVDVLDLDQPPGRDESAFLAALLTAVSRASLWLAPGLLVIAAAISGSGTGKGMLVRAICAIAFGIRPRAFTAGGERHELDKRLAAELVEAGPALFLDNVNGTILRSDTLASVMTERPARVRLLGETRMVPLNSTAFIAVTGNGLSISEDLARRFLVCELDAQCEDPERRPFAAGFLDRIESRRADLLSAALTILVWGRQNASGLARGRPLGGFETWCGWVRDPLVTLGCRDPVERIEEVKANDPHRRRVSELFQTWWHHHGDQPMKVADLADSVRTAADPQGRGRQYLAAHLSRLAGTRAAGFVMTRQEAAGRWGATTYALQQTTSDDADGMRHRDHRGHRRRASPAYDPMPPMPPMVPMPDDVEAATVPPGGETVL